MSVKKTVILGLLTAASIVLAIVESVFAPFFPIPGAKIGLSNIVTMFAFFEFGISDALLVVLAKSVFVFWSRGMVAFTLSLGGGIASVSVIYLLFRLWKDQLSYLLLSVAGAISHNLVQLFFIWLLYGMNLFRYYGALLVLFGVLSGAVTAYLLKRGIPLIQGYMRRLK